MNYFKKLGLLGSISLLGACASTGPVGGAPGVEITQAIDLPAPTQADFVPDADFEGIRAFDVIDVEVFGIEELTRTVQVSAGGSIDFPLVGSVPASGLTTEQLSRELETRLRDTYVRNPDVTLRITERALQFVTVGGEVEKPGRYPVTGPVTLMESVAIGGGMTEFARSQEVLVFRTVGENRYIGVYNLQGIQRGNYPDPGVYPGDIVMLGDNPRRRQLLDAIQLSTAIISPLILLERVLSR